MMRYIKQCIVLIKQTFCQKKITFAIVMAHTHPSASCHACNCQISLIGILVWPILPSRRRASWLGILAPLTECHLQVSCLLLLVPLNYPKFWPLCFFKNLQSMDAAILLLSPILLFLFLPFYSLHATSCSSLGYCIHVAKAQPFVKSHFASNLYLLQDSRNITGKHIIMPINLTSNVSPEWDGKTPHGPLVLWRNRARTTVPFLLSKMTINHLLLSPLPPASPSPSPASFSVPIFSLSLIKQS